MRIKETKSCQGIDDTCELQSLIENGNLGIAVDPSLSPVTHTPGSADPGCNATWSRRIAVWNTRASLIGHLNVQKYRLGRLVVNVSTRRCSQNDMNDYNRTGALSTSHGTP
jgi:hypothetical protein